MFVKYVHLQTLPIDKSIDEPWCQPVNPQKWRRPEYEKTRGLINPRSISASIWAMLWKPVVDDNFGRCTAQ
jgi:hypothetical protein